LDGDAARPVRRLVPTSGRGVPVSRNPYFVNMPGRTKPPSLSVRSRGDAGAGRRGGAADERAPRRRNVPGASRPQLRSFLTATGGSRSPSVLSALWLVGIFGRGLNYSIALMGGARAKRQRGIRLWRGWPTPPPRGRPTPRCRSTGATKWR
jgi:hypothetical protein